MYRPLTPESDTDLPYPDFAISRGISSINGDFMHLDGEGPIGAAIAKAREKGSVALLDAGCGVGLGLIGLKDQITMRTELDDEAVEAVGVSLVDYRGRVGPDVERRVKERLFNSYIHLEIGNLATINLPQAHFDVAYSHEVLLHNDSVEPIIQNIFPTLQSGGTYYFNTLVEQGDEVEHAVSRLPKQTWILESGTLTRKFIGESQSRILHKLMRRNQKRAKLIS